MPFIRSGGPGHAPQYNHRLFKQSGWNLNPGETVYC